MLKRTIGSILTLLGIPNKPPVKFEAPLIDFVYDAAGKTIAVEARESDRLEFVELRKLARMLLNFDDRITEYHIVSPSAPDAHTQNQFYSICEDFIKNADRGLSIKVKWKSAQQFVVDLGVEDEIDILDPVLQDRLLKAALAIRLNIGFTAAPTPGLETFSQNLRDAEKNFQTIPIRNISLRRQFSDDWIAKHISNPLDLKSSLRIGQHIPEVTIVMADLKNFSTFVRLAGPVTMSDVMSEYYEKARDLIWENGGVCVGFEGDAVFAIFNYPEPKLASCLDAYKVAKNLVKLGNLMFSDATGYLDLIESLAIGTRVGMTTGGVNVLTVGHGSFDVSFVGDPINLAARLESNCKVNGILMDNRTKSQLEDVSSNMPRLANAERVELSPQAAKGQLHTIIAWQIAPTQPVDQ